MPKRTIRVLVAAGFLVGGLLLGTPVHAEVSLAAMLANNCAGCHGTNGVSSGPAIPTIAGLSAPYLVTIMAEYKQDRRPSTVMGRIAKGYTEQEIASLAAFFAQQTWQSAKVDPLLAEQAPIDRNLSQKGSKLARVGKCVLCHKNNGVTSDGKTPRLAGQWLDYLVIKMRDLKNAKLNVPQPPEMQKAIDKLSLEELEAIAHFYASQK